MTETVTDWTAEAESIRAQIAATDKRQAQRADMESMDCAASRVGDGLHRRLLELKLDIAENNGLSSFKGLYDLEGVRVRAKVIKGKYGLCWAFCDDRDQFTGKFITAFPAKAKTMRKKGFQELDEDAPAAAKLSGNGKGFSGLTSCYPVTYRTDKGYPDTAIVYRD